MNGREELREEVKLVELMIEENPCKMPDGIFSVLAKGLKALVKEHTEGRMSRSDVASHFHVSERTIQRWEEERDFPKPHRHGHKELSYNADEIIRWKMNNKM